MKLSIFLKKEIGRMNLTTNEILRCRNDFPSLSRTYNGYPLAYLDGPGGTQVPQQVIDAISWYYTTCNANTHGAFITAQETEQVVEEARKAMAAFLGAPSSAEISFGANMTTLTFSLSKALVRELKPGDEIIITELDHEANRGPWLNLQEHGIVIKEAKLKKDGALDYDDFAQKITEKTKLVALGFSSNAIGTINDVALIRKLTREVGAYLLVDAVHYAPHFQLDVQELDVDFLLCSAYKFYGPHVGILYSRKGLLEKLKTDKLEPQENEAPYCIETGTPNHAAINGVKAAVEYIASFGEGDSLREKIVTAMRKIDEYEHGLASYFYDELKKINGVTIHGLDFSSCHRAPTVSYTIDGVNSNGVAKAFAEKGLLVWDGDFFAVKAVHVLGLVEQGGLIRVGISMYNTKEEIDRLITETKKLVGK